MPILCSLLFLLSAHATQVENRIARIYQIGKAGSSEPLFVQKIRVETNGDRREAISTIEDPKGEIVMRESAIYVNGLLVEQSMTQLQINERYEVKVENSKATFRKFDINRKILTKEETQEVAKNFVTGPGIEAFLKTRAEDLAKGDKVLAQFGVFEFARTVEFQFKGLGRSPANENIKLRMKPDSMWLSMLVDPIEMEVDPITYQLRHYKGRTPLRVKQGKDWKPLDAEIIYGTK